MNPKSPRSQKQPQQRKEEKSAQKPKTITAKQRERKNQKLITDYEEKGNRGRGRDEYTLKRGRSIGEKFKGYRWNKVRTVTRVNGKEETQSK